MQPIPSNLRHLDVSFNRLNALPDWIATCSSLQHLFASNNQLETLPDHLFVHDDAVVSALHTLQLDYNSLRSLPPMSPLHRVPLQELFLQNNLIDDLPEHFFSACPQLLVLNVSSNNLQTLPIIADGPAPMERLYATSNYLTDRVLDTLTQLNQLKIIHAAYNRLTTFPESCAQNWPDLEELVLSGNNLQHLPENLAAMPNLKILRVHSNRLQSVPPLARTITLRVLDLAHNQLDKINLVALVSKRLTFLDLSCNNQLQVDPHQLQACRQQRPMSLVDVSGRNRSTLPSTAASHPTSSYTLSASNQPDQLNTIGDDSDNGYGEPPWKIGFSETAGSAAAKLYISQLRLPCFCNNEGLFGIIDGESSRMLPTTLATSIPRILLDERTTTKETSVDYMKYTLLAAHRELKLDGQRQGADAVLCHISLNDPSAPYATATTASSRRRFVLRVASVGQATGILIRKSGADLQLAPNTPNRQIGNSCAFPVIVPDPEVCEITLTDQDEYLVLANRKLWEVLTATAVAKEIRRERNVILAAKRIQDIAQSYGAEENLSLIIVKFNSNLGTDSDYFMRELRHTIGAAAASGGGRKPISNSGFCKCGCCCESTNNCCHGSGVGALQFIRQPSNRSDRSSPSGQSDQTAASSSEMSLYKKISDATSTITSRRSNGSIINNNYVSANERKSIRGAVHRAVRARIEEEKEDIAAIESDSAVSEEQFKCWEYMLEQNTQLLFDKELNTISKAFTKKSATNRGGGGSSSTLAKQQPLSMSTPALSFNEHSPKPVVAQYHQQQQQQQRQNISRSSPFLSRQFGSARSFHPQSTGLFKSLRFGSDRLSSTVQPIGGPNAAYFGSLQRLMPYNLEYDFAVMGERMPPDDSIEYDRRMQQYWGVATTEL